MRLQSFFNEFNDISMHTNAIFKLTDPNRKHNSNVDSIINSRFSEIKGITQTSKQNIISFCSYYLNFEPFRDLEKGEIRNGKK